jgi:lipopolysaccharide export system ATP-binding protein
MPCGERTVLLAKEKVGAFALASVLKFDACPPYFCPMKASPTTPKRLHAIGLVKQYGQRKVVDGVSLEVTQGEVVGLLGPNGAGKTTSFYAVVGLVQADSGQVFIDDQEITSMPMYKRSRLGLGYLPQEASVFRKLSVEDNIAAILELQPLTNQEQKEKLESLLSEFGLEKVRKSRGDVLSGGERRRTEIARALATDPKFILLDEPFAGVDPIAVEDIQRIVNQLRSKNIGILITDHNVQETLHITDRAYLLFEGRILKHGTAEELASDEQVRRVYLGQNFELRQ